MADNTEQDDYQWGQSLGQDITQGANVVYDEFGNAANFAKDIPFSISRKVGETAANAFPRVNEYLFDTRPNPSSNITTNDNGNAYSAPITPNETENLRSQRSSYLAEQEKNKPILPVYKTPEDTSGHDWSKINNMQSQSELSDMASRMPDDTEAIQSAAMVPQTNTFRGEKGSITYNPTSTAESGTITVGKPSSQGGTGEEVSTVENHPQAKQYSEFDFKQPMNSNGSIGQEGHIAPGDYYAQRKNYWGNQASSIAQQLKTAMAARDKINSWLPGASDEIAEGGKRNLLQLDSQINSLTDGMQQAKGEYAKADAVLTPNSMVGGQARYIGRQVSEHNTDVDQQFNNAVAAAQQSNAGDWNMLSRAKQQQLQQTGRDKDYLVSMRARDIENGMSPQQANAMAQGRTQQLSDLRQQPGYENYQPTVRLQNPQQYQMGGPAQDRPLGVPLRRPGSLPRVANYSEMMGQVKARELGMQDEKQQNAMAQRQMGLEIAGERNAFNQHARMAQLQDAEKSLALRAQNAQSADEMRYYRQQALQAHSENEKLHISLDQQAMEIKNKLAGIAESKQSGIDRANAYGSDALSYLQNYGVTTSMPKTGKLTPEAMSLQRKMQATPLNPGESDEDYLDRISAPVVINSLNNQIASTTDKTIKGTLQTKLTALQNRMKAKQQPKQSTQGKPNIDNYADKDNSGV